MEGGNTKHTIICKLVKLTANTAYRTDTRERRVPHRNDPASTVDSSRCAKLGSSENSGYINMNTAEVVWYIVCRRIRRCSRGNRSRARHIDGPPIVKTIAICRGWKDNPVPLDRLEAAYTENSSSKRMTWVKKHLQINWLVDKAERVCSSRTLN
jgi:hypothetical protein